MNPMDVIDALLYKIDLVDLVSKDVELTPSNGGVYRGCCPLHGGDNPTSFVVWNDNRFYCHSCGRTGNAIDYFAEKNGLPFYQAVEKLAEDYEVEVNNEEYQRQKNIYRDNTILANRFHHKVDVVREYLNVKRNISDEMIDEFMLGYDDGNFLGMETSGIVIPIQDSYGRYCGFSKRRLDTSTKGKYRNTKESPDGVFRKREILFNYHRAIKLIKKTNTLYIAEGYLDVISAHQQGLACVGYLGGKMTKEQIKLLWELQKLYKDSITFILAVDNPDIDPTGRKAIVATRESVQRYAPKLNMKVIRYPREGVINEAD